MTARVRKTEGHLQRFMGLLRGPVPRRGPRTRMVPRLETLEAISLLSVGCPVISGHVFLDENSVAALTNNGLLNPGETLLPNASIELLNSSGQVIGTTKTDANGFYQFTGVVAPGATTQTITQTVTVPNTLTNIPTTAFAPALGLFNPSLGTLLDVKVSALTNFTSQIQSHNLSTSSGATITGNVSGTYNISGLNLSLSGTPSGSTAPTAVTTNVNPSPPNFSGSDAVTFPAVNATDTKSSTFTDAASLAFYTATSSQTTISPAFTATGAASATAVNGNLFTSTMTSASSTITVTYDYTPSTCFAPGNYTILQLPDYPGFTDGKESRNGTVLPANGAPPNPAGTPQSIPITLGINDAPNNDFAKLTTPAACPTVASVVRLGIHHQLASYFITFSGPVNPADANNVNNYTLISTGKRGQFNAPGSHTVPIASVTYNATNNTVNLVPVNHLNLHDRFLLRINLPCFNGNPFVTVVGGKSTVINLTGHSPRLFHGRSFRRH